MAVLSPAYLVSDKFECYVHIYRGPWIIQVNSTQLASEFAHAFKGSNKPHTIASRLLKLGCLNEHRKTLILNGYILPCHHDAIL